MSDEKAHEPSRAELVSSLVSAVRGHAKTMARLGKVEGELKAERARNERVAQLMDSWEAEGSEVSLEWVSDQVAAALADPEGGN